MWTVNGRPVTAVAINCRITIPRLRAIWTRVATRSRMTRLEDGTDGAESILRLAIAYLGSIVTYKTMAKTSTADTLAEEAYSAIRDDILGGRFGPGAHLKAAELRHLYGGVSLTVIREALNRLAAQRLVVARRNQGFFVAEVTAKGIRDLTAIRVLNEGHALRLSIQRGDFDWESRVVAAHHRLKRIPPLDSDERRGTTEAWQRAHRHFHEELISACDVPVLLEICDTLLDGSELYRRVASRVGETDRDVAREHEEIMEAAVAREVDTAVELFEAHVQRTAATVVSALEGEATSPVAG